MSKSKTDFYEKYILEGISKGWGSSHDNYMLDGKIQREKVIGDLCWGQGFYGIYLAFLKDEILKIKLTDSFLSGVEGMLKDTYGIFLRDNSDEAIEEYRKADTEMEISKDQFLGLTTALYLLHETTTHHIFKERIKNIVMILSENLRKHYWFIYNENERRKYNSANYCHVHHSGIATAFSRILGIFRKRNVLEYVMTILGVGKKFASFNLQNMRDIKDIKCWWQRIPFLKKFSWYYNEKDGYNFRAGVYPFNLNLVFFEFVIGAFDNKSSAKWIIKELDKEGAKKTKNINLAAVYVFACSKWGLEGKSMEFWKQITETRDEAIHMDNVLPNELHIGSPWVIDQGSMWTHELLTDEEWNTYVSAVGKGDQKKLEEASSGRRIVCGNGLVYSTRFALRNFKRI